MRVLITGGTGLLGSVTVERLTATGHTAVVYDDHGRGEAVGATLIDDGEKLRRTLRDNSIEAVIHLTAGAAESIRDPRRAFGNILANTAALLDAMLDCGVLKIVFSGSAAVYGTPEAVPVTEAAVTAPTTPHGEACLAVERMLRRYDEAYGLRYVTLRCFNVAGASEMHGEAAATDLIPNILRAAAGESPVVPIFGEDYATPDGTCVRDFVHVIDAADAHLLALNALERSSETYNVGYGSGYSVAEVVEMARQVTGKWVSTEAAPRRPGDPPVLIAGVDKIMRDLGWNPRHSELDRIIESAWKWKQKGNRKDAKV